MTLRVRNARFVVLLLLVTEFAAACGPHPTFDVVISSRMTACDVTNCHAWVLLTPVRPTSRAPAQAEVQLVGITRSTTARTDPRHLLPIPHRLRFRQTSGMADGEERQTATCEVVLQPMTDATPGTAYVDVTFAGASCTVAVEYVLASAPPSLPPPP